MENKELDERFASTELEEIKKENERIKTEMGITKTTFEKEIGDLKKEQQEKVSLLSSDTEKMSALSEQINDITKILLEVAKSDKRFEGRVKKHLRKMSAIELARAIR